MTATSTLANARIEPRRRDLCGLVLAAFGVAGARGLTDADLYLACPHIHDGTLRSTRVLLSAKRQLRETGEVRVNSRGNACAVRVRST